jgi:hypothetical protein
MSVDIVLVSLLFLMGWRPAADSLPYMSQHIDRQEATIGERIHFTVRIFTEEDHKVIIPEHTLTMSRFVVKQRDSYERRRKAAHITTIVYELANYDVGWDTIPEISFGILQGNDTTMLVSGGVSVEIKSVAPNMTGEEDIRGLRPQIGMKMPAWQYLLFLTALGLTVAIVIFLLWWRRRAVIPEKVEERPPWEIAIAALEGLSGRNVRSPDEVNRFYTELSYILRRYYENRFLFPAVEHTTSEIMKELRAIGEVRPYLHRTGDFLTKSDMVKFAKYVPKSVDRELEIGLVREIVESTMEKEAAEAVLD